MGRIARSNKVTRFRATHFWWLEKVLTGGNTTKTGLKSWGVTRARSLHVVCLELHLGLHVRSCSFPSMYVWCLRNLRRVWVEHSRSGRLELLEGFRYRHSGNRGLEIVQKDLRGECKHLYHLSPTSPRSVSSIRWPFSKLMAMLMMWPSSVMTSSDGLDNSYLIVEVRSQRRPPSDQDDLRVVSTWLLGLPCRSELDVTGVCLRCLG